MHITPERNARHIARSGVPRSRGWSGDRSVYCMPVPSPFTLTYQWCASCGAGIPACFVADRVRVPDDERVTVGRYGTQPQLLEAAQPSLLSWT